MFTLAHESAPVEGWLTEKVYQALSAGSVPVYRGAADVAARVPCDECVIDASAMTPRALLDELAALVGDARAYARLRAWRDEPYDPARFAGFEREARALSLDGAPCRLAALARPAQFDGTCGDECLEEVWALQSIGYHG